MIWLECLDRRPKLYTFDLAKSNQRCSRWQSSNINKDITAIKPIFGIYFTQEPALVASSVDRRILSEICAESRKTVLKVFPNILRFEFFGENSISSNDDPANVNEKTGNRVGFCRYNSTLDVICLRFIRNHMYLFPKIMSMTSEPFSAFQAIQNLALIYDFDDDDVLSPEYTKYPIGAPHNPDACTCLEGLRSTTCREDMLPRFIRCFPSLKKLIMNAMSPRPCEYYWDETQVIRYTGCKCFPDLGDSSSLASAKKHHLWQLVPIHNHQSQEQESECIAIVYDEDTDCAGLNLGPSKVWDDIDTSYEPSEHLVMRYLHPRDAQGRWQQPRFTLMPAPSHSPLAASENIG
ncbi:hypothetical protein MCOR25_009213 [Pyricularia grisea]|nr:hypothetical protein MCOR25_009213 [Pyricularia grisea]